MTELLESSWETKTYSIDDVHFDHNDYEFQQDTMTTTPSEDNLPFFDWNEWQSPEQILENARAFAKEIRPDLDAETLEPDVQTLYKFVMKEYWGEEEDYEEAA